jgi:hypothetical protein
MMMMMMMMMMMIYAGWVQLLLLLVQSLLLTCTVRTKMTMVTMGDHHHELDLPLSMEWTTCFFNTLVSISLKITSYPK